MLRLDELISLELELLMGGEVLEEVGEEELVGRKLVLLIPDSVCTPPPSPGAGPGSSLLLSLGYIPQTSLRFHNQTNQIWFIIRS